METGKVAFSDVLMTVALLPTCGAPFAAQIVSNVCSWSKWIAQSECIHFYFQRCMLIFLRLVAWTRSVCAGSMGQVMHRLRLDWTGKPTRMAKTIRTFQIVATLACLYWISQVLYSWKYTNDMWMSNFTTADGQVTTGGGSFLMIFFIAFTASNLFFLIWSLCALTRTRMNVRERYNIRGSACGDFCCAIWCRCCTVAQLHRHTGDYENHQSLCCSKTGLHEHINVV